MDFHFEPDAGRAQRLDQRIRSQLAASLEKSVSACAGQLTWQPEQLDRTLAALRTGAVRPVIFSLYGSFIEALFADRLAAAQTLLDRLLSEHAPATSHPQILTLDDACLGAGNAARFEAEIITQDPAATHLPFKQPEFRRHRAAIQSALTWLGQAAPAFAGEMQALLREIILARRVVAGEPDTGLTGASSFFLWGAAFIKFASQPDRLALAEALVHESAHMLLFGFTLGAPLVTNPPQERHASPLRQDARPMDGVVHAAYVLARITLFYTQLLQSGFLSAQEASTAAAAITQCRRQFGQADTVIARDASFTEPGAAAFNAARSWMHA